jgi:DNA helicase HerA-like ATPase
VQQKNKYGYARAKARKIGAWDVGARKFNPVPWMPRINAPVFMLENGETAPDADCIGHFPSTPYGVRLAPSDCVTHNTAILGILGVGKSYLSIELVERMIARGIRVLCLDLTNQYEQLLADFIDPAHEERRRDALVGAGRGGTPHKNKEQGGSRNSFVKAVLDHMRQFMAADDDHYLWVLNPAQFRVTKQVSGMYNNDADLAHLTAAEITSIFSNAALVVCQELGMTDDARLCLVYEEAHSLVPEWNSVAADGDRLATATSARAILQGRKYGLGCLLITQRTANVTKTILNQCNTIFAMRTFDDTGKEFLGNYIGSDYANILPSLQPRHAVIFGKASSCENPVLIRLNDQDAFRKCFRPTNPPRQPRPAPVDAAAAVQDQ